MVVVQNAPPTGTALVIAHCPCPLPIALGLGAAAYLSRESSCAAGALHLGPAHARTTGWRIVLGAAGCGGRGVGPPAGGKEGGGHREDQLLEVKTQPRQLTRHHLPQHDPCSPLVTVSIETKP